RPCGGRVIIVMGGHHAISGAAAWLALTGSASLGGYRLGGGVLDLAGPEVLAGAVVAAGRLCCRTSTIRPRPSPDLRALPPSWPPPRSARRLDTGARHILCWLWWSSPCSVPWPPAWGGPGTRRWSVTSRSGRWSS